jgi:hypothetical protein
MSIRIRYRTAGWLAGAAVAAMGAQSAAAGAPRAVVELFTSQGCSSCPPADALVGRLSTDPDLLVLSFHVNYWDSLGWKDPFASQASTDRQYAYARSLGQRSVFTPQIVVDGTHSVVGSQESALQHALASSRQASLPIQGELSKQSDGRFSLTLTGPALSGDIWVVRYVKHAVTRIRAGENGGRNLETFNNVTHIQRLGSFSPRTILLDPLKGTEDGIAVFVQAPGAGRMLGAVTYQPHG